MKELIQKIKTGTSLVDLCERYGIKLAKQGGSFKALCPFHQETTPSFTVYPDSNRYCCYSCGAKGDVIDFAMANEGVGFRDAVERLAGQLGVASPSASKVSPPLETRVNEIIDDAAGFYHFILRSRLEASDPLVNGFLQARGISVPTATRFRLGFAPNDHGIITSLLDKKGYSLDEVLESGVVRMDIPGMPNPFFRNRIIFPFLKNGRALYLTGRSIDGSEPKYLNLPGSDHIKKGIYNLDAFRASAGYTLITEGIIDCVIAEQHGFSAVALAGLEAGQGLAEMLGGRNAYIVFDSEASGAGGKGAEKLASALLSEGRESRIITLPRSRGMDKVDLSDFLTREGKDSLKPLLERAPGLVDLRIDRACALPVGEQLRFIREEIFPLICHNKVGEMDLAMHLEKLKERLKLKTDMFQSLKKEAKKFRVTAPTTKPGNSAGKDISSMSDEDRAEALRYLRDPALFGNLVTDIRTVGLVGEDTNAQALYLFSLTRKTDKPISAVVFGDSSAGKSHLVKSICSLIPEEDKLVLSSASAKSFEHASEDQLKHKFIVLQEIEGMEEVEPTIRVMQSEGKLARFVATKNEETGQIETIHKDIECPASIITTTTKDRVHAENSTRIFELYVNQTPEQTAQIHDLQREKVGLGWASKEKEQARVRATHMNAQRLIRNIKVIIPFAKHISFPQDTIRSRRDFDRFLGLIQAVAIFRQFRKEARRMEDGEEYIEADLEDYEVAYGLGEKLFASTFSLISDRAKNVLKACLAIGQDGFSRSDIRKKAKEVGIHISENNKMLADQLRSLEDVDAIESVEGGKGKAYLYRLKVKSVEDLDQNQVKSIPTAEQIGWEMYAEEMGSEAEGELGCTSVN